MWRMFEGAFIRKLGYLAAAAVVMFLLGHRARADQVCYAWHVTASYGSFFGTQTGGGSEVCGSLNYSDASDHTTATLSAGTPETPTAPGVAGSCHHTDTFTSGYTGQEDVADMTSVVVTCPTNQCTANQDKHYMIAPPSGAPMATGSNACSSDGCQYTMDNPNGVYAQDGVTQLAGPFQIVEGGSGKGIAMQSAMNTGSTCTAGGSLPTITPGPIEQPGAQMCQSAGGTTVCDTQGADGKNCGTVNGDRVCVDALPPGGGCVSFASGGVACTMPAGSSGPASPPFPDTGTPGVAATPDATVQLGQQTADYFSSSTVAGSSHPVTSTGAGSTGSPNGGGTGTGTAPCPPGQTCTGTTDSVSGGGDCAAPPVCMDTDPVLCGIVNQQWLLRCENPTESQLQTATGDPGTIAASSAGDFSTATSESGVFSGASATCPAPVSVSVMGKTLVLDWWAGVCSFAGSISAMVMLLAYLVAARIMYVGVTGGQVST